MQTKAFLRSLVAISVAATISACGDNGEDAATLLEQQLAAEQAIEQQEQATEDSIAGSSGTDPLPPTSPEPSTTESLTIAVPGGTDYSTGAYPWNPEGATKFWYGLDEHEVVVPEASVANNVYHLTFAGEYHPETGEAGPGAELQEVLWEKTGDVTIVLPEGTFKMNDQLRVDFSLDEYAGITSITIMGHGIDKTILSYTEAADAVSDSVHFSVAKDIEIAHFTVVDSSKNAILVDESDGVYMHHLGAIWPGKPDKDNGAYGLYPVESDNVIMEDSFSFGSADAGIYVGQTNNIVVRRNFAVQNVAGIEIENSDNADVYDNYAYMNTGGLLVFDLPIGNGRYGFGTRVFRNVSVSNNEDNFAAHGVVGLVPPGTGMLILASEGVEVFDNDFVGNETFAVVATSYFLVDQDVTQYTGNPVTMQPGQYSNTIADGWRPTVRNVNIRDNRISDTGRNPRGDLLEAPLAEGAPGVLSAFEGINGYLPAILFDGLGQNLSNLGVLASIGELPYQAGDNFCATNNSDVSTGTVIEHTGAIPVLDLMTFQMNLDAATFEVDNFGTHLFNCQLDPLPAYSATFRGQAIGCGEDDNGEICQSAAPATPAE